MTKAGTMVTYTGGDRHPWGHRALPSGDMRQRSSIASTVRLCVVLGVGAYLGASVGGLIPVVTGRVFAHGSPWLVTVPMLAIAGAGLGMVVSWLTRTWLLRRIPRRRWTFAGTGVVTLPLFTAIGQSDEFATVSFALAAVGGAVMLVTYWRASSGSVSMPGSR